MTMPTTMPTTTAALAQLRAALDQLHAEERARKQEEHKRAEALIRLQEGKAEAFCDEYFSGWLAEALAPIHIKANGASWHLEFDFDTCTWRIDGVQEKDVNNPQGSPLVITRCRLVAPAHCRTVYINAEQLETAILNSLAEHEIYVRPTLIAIS